MFCKNCGTQLNEGAHFCPSCGAKQTSGSDVTTVLNQPTVPVATQSNGAGYGSAPSNTNQPNYDAPKPNYAYQPQYGNNPNFNAMYTYTGPVPPVEPGVLGIPIDKAVKLFFKNYVNFTGRSTCGEYWWVMLFNIIVSMGCFLVTFVVPILGVALIYAYALAVLIPGLALCVRRLHDIGKSWSWIFMGFIPLAGSIILIVYMATPSSGDNRWGPAPINKNYPGNGY